MKCVFLSPIAHAKHQIYVKYKSEYIIFVVNYVYNTPSIKNNKTTLFFIKKLYTFTHPNKSLYIKK